MNAAQGNMMFTSIPLDELTSQLLKGLKVAVNDCLNERQNEQFLSPTELCGLFNPKLSKTTLAKYTKQGRFTAYNVCGRVVYKYGEVMSAIQGLKKYQRNTLA
jgi:hypothetical protein